MTAQTNDFGHPGSGYRAIAEAILRQIAAGELAPGARLPPVRVAAARWGVNVNTVQRAYACLAAQGVVVARAGRGTRVAPAAAEAAVALRAARLHQLVGEVLAAALALGYQPAEVAATFTAQLARWRAARQRRGDPAAGPQGPARSVRLAGSHDLCMEVLVRQLRAGRPRWPIRWRPSSSLAGLFALATDACDLAGCHLLDAASGEYNAPFVERLLPGEPVLLVTVAEREQGLLVAPGNPAGVRAVRDLARPGVRFVNRPRGSGTRLLLDRLLAAAGVSPAAVAGYEREVPTHLAVAVAVATGAADVGLGIRAAAQAAGLDFVPLARERYELALRAEQQARPEVAAVLAALRAPAFRAAAQALGGYDLAQAGSVRRVG
ncbi:MAG TPA: substrate-binding domain-containing protein [Chloroflexota bacterium]|nr:substrate-binding domain-containing protein [Chloroflexota bacterium]